MKPYDRHSEKEKASFERVLTLLEEQESIQQELLDGWWKHWKTNLFTSGNVSLGFLAKLSCENTQ